MTRTALAVLALTVGCTVHTNDSSDSTLTVTNQSSFDIEQLFITQNHSATWGPNLLGSQPLLPGEVILLDGIACDTYDVLLVDETSAECEVDAFSLCFDDADWVITNNTCAVFTSALAASTDRPAQLDHARAR
jgi:hypothetical protein